MAIPDLCTCLVMLYFPFLILSGIFHRKIFFPSLFYFNMIQYNGKKLILQFTRVKSNNVLHLFL